MTECRMAVAADKAALAANWTAAFGDGKEFTDFVFDRFAGLENTFVACVDGQLAASVCAVPVTLGRWKGVYLYGVNTRQDLRGKGIMDILLRWVHKKAETDGCDFSVLVPAGESLFDYYAAYGYKTLFARRKVCRDIRANLWAQAEFDTLTAARLTQLRRRFLGEEVVSFEGSAHNAMLQDLYTAGATTVEHEGGYGIFFEKGETLYFKEFVAADDRAAARLLEAARQRTGAVKAEVWMPAHSPVFLGEGGPEIPYGQLLWLRGEKRLLEPYMGLMCD